MHACMHPAAEAMHYSYFHCTKEALIGVDLSDWRWAGVYKQWNGLLEWWNGLLPGIVDSVSGFFFKS